MAGIGFRLRAYTQEGTLRSLFRGYYHAMLVAAGPWILTVLSLVTVQYFMRANVVETRTFLETIIYIYAWTLITTAPLQLVVTRYLADQLDAQKLGTHMPCLVTVTAVSAVFHAVLGMAFMLFVHVPWAYRFTAVALFVLVAETWLVMAFIGSLRAYHLVATSFLSGTGAGIVTSYIMGRYLGETGYLVGMVVGQAVVLAVALSSLAREFEFDQSADWRWLAYFRRYPMLPAAGAVYYLAIWLTLMIYWWGPEGYLIKGAVLYAYPPMDLASFYAQMTIIPTITAFYVHCETQFYEDYRGFYNAILTRKPLDFIVECRKKMTRRLKEAMFSLGLIQVTVTLGAITFADQIQVVLQMTLLEKRLFQNVCIGALPQVMLLFVLVILFYFQFYRQALAASLVALAGSLLGGLISLKLGQLYYGLGLALGTGLGFLVGLGWLLRQMERLEYLTFTQQPMAERVPYRPDMWLGDGLGNRVLREGGKP